MNRFVLGFLLAFSALVAEAQTTTFNYTGAQQTIVVPAGITSAQISAQGAAGWVGSNPGGLGGSASGTLTVTPGETLYIYVGGQGTAATVDHVPAGGGFNGGGNGMTNTAGTTFVGGGGGASDVRRGGAAVANRVLVAAGGGGSTNNTGTFGGDGGGLVGADGGTCCGGVTARGGSQVAGGALNGSLAQGGNADPITQTPWIGGGGGGYYGGGTSDMHSGGAGGSSYLGGVTGGATTAGVRSGDGVVVVSFSTAVATAVPTLSQWMIVLLAVMVVASVILLRKRT
jgi:Glycine rich protein